jgi:predicted protein tyrosine phosphatase
MESGTSVASEDAVKLAMRTAAIAQKVRKKAEKAAKELLDLARRELKRKGKLIDDRKTQARKKTVHLYFQSIRGT